MPVYVIANVKLKDDAWIPEYAAAVHGIVHKHGGKYYSRSANITTVEGEAPDLDVIALIEFPSMDAVRGFMEDPEYAPYQKARIDGTVSSLLVIDNTDVAGTIPYLEKPPQD